MLKHQRCRCLDEWYPDIFRWSCFFRLQALHKFYNQFDYLIWSSFNRHNGQKCHYFKYSTYVSETETNFSKVVKLPSSFFRKISKKFSSWNHRLLYMDTQAFTRILISGEICILYFIFSHTALEALLKSPLASYYSAVAVLDYALLGSWP